MPDTSPAGDRVTLGMVGLGRMGANLVRRAMADGHHCVVCDSREPAAVEALVADGASGRPTSPPLVEAAAQRRARCG